MPLEHVSDLSDVPTIDVSLTHDVALGAADKPDVNKALGNVARQKMQGAPVAP
jgi:hypothetical protein